MLIIMIPIHHEYVEKIFSGEKVYEFRKNIPRYPVSRILFYETKPMGKIVGEAKALITLTGHPENLWEKTKDRAGISKELFSKYFKGQNLGFAYELAEVERYEKPVELSERGITFPPQSFTIVGVEEE